MAVVMADPKEDAMGEPWGGRWVGLKVDERDARWGESTAVTMVEW